MHGFFRNPLATLAAVALIGIGSFGVSAQPAAALSQDGRDALGVIVGLGATALIVDSLTRNDRQKAHRAPQPRYQDHRHGWDNGPRHGRFERRGPSPRGWYAQNPRGRDRW